MSSVDLDPNPADRIARIAAQVRELGNDRTIVNAMTRRIRRSFTPIKRKVKAGTARLPQGGGLAAWVAKAGIRVSVKRGVRLAGVEVVGSRKSTKRKTDLRRIDSGSLRAPYFGHRKAWHLQKVNPGFFTEPMTEHVDEFRADIVRAIDEAEGQVFGRG